MNSQALRHSAQAHHGRARNNTQATHERDYQLQDEDVRAASRGAVELGLAQAVASARQTVAMRLVARADAEGEVSAELVAKEAGIDVEVAHRIVAGRLRTPVASCADFLNSDHSQAGMPCAVSFLLCFACRNAVATGRDLPRIAYLHQALESLRSAVTLLSHRRCPRQGVKFLRPEVSQSKTVRTLVQDVGAVGRQARGAAVDSAGVIAVRCHSSMFAIIFVPGPCKPPDFPLRKVDKQILVAESGAWRVIEICSV
ncbi:hypothetical protein OHU34_43705 (plasmid) [Streptomyces sp. NBC_00080]|uniref:hypothetical protein n=1 Tax=Streptomyces sp. NBC_00080 TaxID=2975645 RepID=UPI002F909471